MKTTQEELLYLADQEKHERGMMKPDNHDDHRASMVKEWALRQVDAQRRRQPLFDVMSTIDPDYAESFDRQSELQAER